MSDRPHFNGEPLISSEELASLLGVPVELLRACVAAQRDPDGTPLQSARLPAAWLEQGRSRADVYRQATGRDDMSGALEFWRKNRRPSRQDKNGGAA